jgi:hypothetical protein
LSIPIAIPTHAFQRILVPAGKNKLGARAMKGVRKRFSDSRRSAGDPNDFVLEFHCLISLNQTEDELGYRDGRGLLLIDYDTSAVHRDFILGCVL